jgi:5-hydroxyisourate hydrolase
MSTITTHVLDLAKGTPASGITVVIEIGQGPDRWLELARGVTDGDGRIAHFTPPLELLKRGPYRLRFVTALYFATSGVHGFYPEIDVIVQIDDPAQHYHIPVLLSPFGYSTYRGS